MTAATGGYRARRDAFHSDGEFFTTTAILFGLGGTLIDIAKVVEESWRVSAAVSGVLLNIPSGLLHGMRPRDTLRIMMPELTAAAREQVVKQVLAAQTDTDIPMPLTPGAADLWASIPADRWAVVKSAERHFAAKIMCAARIPAPLGLITGDDVEYGKPHPQPFLMAAQSLRIPEPSMCVAVEGSPAGVLSAQRAGMRVVAVAATFSDTQLADANWIVDDLRSVRATKIPDGLYVELARPSGPVLNNRTECSSAR